MSLIVKNASTLRCMNPSYGLHGPLSLPTKKLLAPPPAPAPPLQAEYFVPQGDVEQAFDFDDDAVASFLPASFSELDADDFDLPPLNGFATADAALDVLRATPDAPLSQMQPNAAMIAILAADALLRARVFKRNREELTRDIVAAHFQREIGAPRPRPSQHRKAPRLPDDGVATQQRDEELGRIVDSFSNPLV